MKFFPSKKSLNYHIQSNSEGTVWGKLLITSSPWKLKLEIKISSYKLWQLSKENISYSATLHFKTRGLEGKPRTVMILKDYLEGNNPAAIYYNTYT